MSLVWNVIIRVSRELLSSHFRCSSGAWLDFVIMFEPVLFDKWEDMIGW